MRFVTPITFTGGPRDLEADVFELGKMPNTIKVEDPPGEYRARRLEETNRYIFLWVPAGP